MIEWVKKIAILAIEYCSGFLRESYHQGVGAVGELLIKSKFVATSWDGF